MADKTKHVWDSKQQQYIYYLEKPMICKDCGVKLGMALVLDIEANRKLLSVEVPCTRGCE